MNSKLNQLLAALIILASSPAWAASNPPGGTCSTGEGCEPCCDDSSTSSSSSPDSSSLKWGIKVGLARYAKPAALTDFGQAAFEKNGNLPDFKQLFGRYFSSSPLQQRQIHLELFQTQLSAATFHPSCLFLQSEALFEIFKKPAAGGFPEFIHQILTDDAFTLIDVLPAPDSGWRLRVWKRDAASLVKTGGFYDTTVFTTKTPLNDVVFKRPAGSSGDDTLIYIQKETTGLSGTRTITNEIVQTLDANGKPATVSSKVFAGEGTAGPLLSQENLSYSERGTKVWDYTIVREILTASVDAAGTIGALTRTGRTRENYDDSSTTAIGGELGMKRLMSRTEAFDVPGQSPQTTTYTYIQSPTNPSTHGRLQSEVRPDGSWTYNEYAVSSSSPVSIITEYTGWKDLTLAQRANARKTVTTVSANESLVETFVAGQLVSKSRTTLTTIGGDPATTSENWDGSGWHATTTAYYPDNFAAPSTGRIKWIENSDGTATTYSYATVSSKLVTTARTGAGTRAGITAGTEIATTYGLGNHPVSQVTKDIASNLEIEQWTTDLTYNSGFDQLGRPIKRIYHNDQNDYDIAQHACCGLEFSRDRMGATATYSRDGLKRVYKMETKASAASPVVATFTTVDGLTTTQTRRVGAADALFIGSQIISLDGLTRTITAPSVKSTAIADRPVTTTVITRSATGDTATTTYEDDSTSIIASYLDGRTKSVSGTAVPDMTYDYGTHAENGGGETSSTNASGVVTTRFTDLLGRTRKTVSGANGTTSHAYHPLNSAPGSRTKLLSVTDGDGVIITYGYNGEGAQTTTYRSIPLPGNTTATQVTTTDEDVVPDVTLHGVSLGVSIRRTQTISSTGIAPIIVSESYASRDRLKRASSSLGNHTVSEITRPDSSGIATRSTTRPDGTRTVETRTHGLATRVENQNASTAHNVISAVDYGYDIHQRLETVTDSRTGNAGKTTYSNFTESGAPLTTTQGTTAPNIRVTSVEKDILGRVIQTTLPDNSVAHTSHWPTGQVKARWGSQTNPVFHIYDEQNRPKELHTWQSAPTLTQTTAAPPAGSAKTEWIYGSASGHLVEKNHPGETDDGITDPDYTYTFAGRLLTRTWERGITTNYGYTNGMLTSTDYSDSTPDVSITYEPLGRQQSIASSVAKSEFTHDPATLAVDTETLSYNLDGAASYEFTRVLDRKPTSLGRDTGWELKDGTTVENQVTYGYSASTGRLETVANAADTFTYGYLTGSNLLQTVSKSVSGGNPAIVATRAYESTRDTLASIENKAGTTVRSRYDYTVVNGGVNNIGQRMGVRSSFDLGVGHTTNAGDTSWGYDSIGQVNSAAAPGTAADRAYQFDAIGNRIEARDGVTVVSGIANYAANALNQYTLAKGVTLPTTPAPAPYDLDGNLRFDGGVNNGNQPRECRWDAENRLIEVRDANGTPLVAYTYDAQSRRISSTQSPISNPQSTLYLYDAWNCIAEWSADLQSASLTRTRTWGMDLSGSMQGAGGVGGLLSETINNQPSTINFFPTYDGNGNISEYLSTAGAVIAHFEYDPFGNTVVNTDTSNQFAYRFSTKPLDQTTGLYYYGYRWYDPLTGRWPSRDPIEEMGGVNLYEFVGNNTISSFDLLGLHCRDCWKELDDCNERARMTRQFALESVKSTFDQMERDADNQNTACQRMCDSSYSWDPTGLGRSLCYLGCSEVWSVQYAMIIVMRASAIATVESLHAAARIRCQNSYDDCLKGWGEDYRGCPCISDGRGSSS